MVPPIDSLLPPNSWLGDAVEELPLPPPAPAARLAEPAPDVQLTPVDIFAPAAQVPQLVALPTVGNSQPESVADRGTVHGANDETLIRVEDVWVDYEIFQAADGSRNPLARNRAVAVTSLQGVSVELRRGDALGLVGMNGAGKSTLVRTMAGLQPASSGRVWVRSQPRLLGVNSAMRARLSGRQNIELGCVALGYSREEARVFEEGIIEFSGLDGVIDRPIQSYSSGMRARLGFSIATVESPEILLLDEALAVGDANFKQKSLAKLEKLKRRAGAIVMVSHSLGEIRRVCDRVIWLDDGHIVADGDPEEVLDAYRAAAREERQVERNRKQQGG